MAKQLTQVVLKPDSEFPWKWEKGPIYQLGISAIPGTAININNSPSDLIINNTGIFQIDIEDDMPINSITIERPIFPVATQYIILDIIYEEGAIIQ